MTKRAEKKAAFLTRDLNLSADQQALFDLWQEGQQDLRQDRMERHMSHKGQHLEALLDGQTFEREDQAAEHIESMKTQAELMMDFVDALDNDQRAQLVSNVEAMAERAAERAEKGHKGNRKGKPQR
jgi:alpha-galactosidase/6-phospho-beta-glucosidase family protein